MDNAETGGPDDTVNRLVQAALPHVPFDGWTRTTFQAAVADTGLDPAHAALICPRGALDLAVAFHRAGDRDMAQRLAAQDLAALKIRERVTLAVQTRLDVAGNKEVVRRGATLFALPQNAATGSGLIWGTADAIWTALGDTSDDVNWYTKRATLVGVYGSTVLFWLGDDSPDGQATRDFLDRRIGDVMQIEKMKAQVRGNAFLQKVLSGPAHLLGRIRAPVGTRRDDVPGRWPPDERTGA